MLEIRNEELAGSAPVQHLGEVHLGLSLLFLVALEGICSFFCLGVNSSDGTLAQCSYP